MRCFAVRLAVAVFTFGLGIIVAFCCYQTSKIEPQSELEKVVVPDNAVLQTEPRLEVEPLTDSEQEEEFICRSNKLQSIWNVLKDDLISLGRETDQTPNKYCENYINIEKVVDLNEDGVRELIVSSKIISSYHRTYGYENNTWILQPTKTSGYKIIFVATGTIEVKKKRTNGYYDLQTRFYEPKVGIQYNRLNKFDGKQYDFDECWNKVCTVKGKNGKWRRLRKPLVYRRISCC